MSAVLATTKGRRVPRLVPALECQVFFHFNGQRYQAVLQDVSPYGVLLKLNAKTSPAGIEKNGEIDFQIHSNRQKAIERRGRVVWIGNRPDGQLYLGLEYLEPLEEETLPTLLDMNLVKIDPIWALRVPSNLAVRRQVLPFAEVDGEIHVACANASDMTAIKALERYINRPMRPQAAEPQSLRRALQKVYGEKSFTLDAGDPVALLKEFLYAAFLRQASDIHIDPERDGVRVRLRVDGALEDYRKISTKIYPELISRIKVLAGMDIAEKRSPQDGSFTQEFSAEESVDIRVATLPTKYGERVGLRLLAMQTESLTLENLGMSARDLEIFEQSISRPHGLLLATGPTGSGKTTTLYAALRRIISQQSLNVISVQDPIEYDIPGVAQVEVDSAQKVTFAKALRSILRHDPDVLMIGEIRDRETADIAIKAALTGHLVIATLHTNSAVSAITRLHDMGVERYLTAATLRLSLAQRLVRQLCSYCRQKVRLNAEQARALRRPDLEGMEVYESQGCIYCGGRGYGGRIGLFEMLPLDEELSKAVAQGKDESEFLEILANRKAPTIMDDAVEKLRAGITSLHEVLAAVAV